MNNKLANKTEILANDEYDNNAEEENSILDKNKNIKNKNRSFVLPKNKQDVSIIDYRAHNEIKKILEEPIEENAKSSQRPDPNNKLKDSFIKIMNKPILLKPKLIADLKKHAKLEKLVNDQRKTEVIHRRPSIKELKDFILHSESNVTKNDESNININNINNDANIFTKLELPKNEYLARGRANDNTNNFQKIYNSHL